MASRKLGFISAAAEARFSSPLWVALHGYSWAAVGDHHSPGGRTEAVEVTVSICTHWECRTQF